MDYRVKSSLPSLRGTMKSCRIKKSSCQCGAVHRRVFTWDSWLLKSSWGSDSGTWEGWAATGNERGQRADPLKVTFLFIDLIICTPGPSWKKVCHPLSHTHLTPITGCAHQSSERSWWEVAACSLCLCEYIFLPQPHPTSRQALSLQGIPHIQRTALWPRNQPQGPVGTPCHPPLPPVTTATPFSAPTPPN